MAIYVCWSMNTFQNLKWGKHDARKKEYLDAELNITKMFQIDRPELRDKVKYSFYCRYFKETSFYHSDGHKLMFTASVWLWNQN